MRVMLRDRPGFSAGQIRCVRDAMDLYAEDNRVIPYENRIGSLGSLV